MRRVLRMKNARCMINAKAMPMTSSTATVITVMSAVVPTSCHHTGSLSTIQ